MNPSTGPVDVLVSRPKDGGLTWGSPVVVNNDGNFNDKNWSVCDDTASSPFFGNCYTEFDNASGLNTVQMSTSTDGGASWSAAEQLAGPMTPTWLPLTDLGFMVGDYISTSIVPGDDDATPVFAVATAPFNRRQCLWNTAFDSERSINHRGRQAG